MALLSLHMVKLKERCYTLFKVCVIYFLLQASVLVAQDRDRSKVEDLESSLQDKITTGVVQPAGVALESIIDPEKYFIGPSDAIAVNIWTNPPLNFLLTVTPEGTLIIPTIGEIPVADITLSKAKEKIVREIRKKYTTGGISTTLVKPRPIVVLVTGNVESPGRFTLTSVDRVDRAIREANRKLTIAREDTIVMKSSMSARNIILQRRDGSVQRVDLQKYLATKEESFNPYLREGDFIIVPQIDSTVNYITIYGAVNAPGRFEYIPGDKFMDALTLVHGFTRTAITDSVELSRLDESASMFTTQVVNCSDFQKGVVPEIVLQPGDRIVVKEFNSQRKDYRVRIEGEVIYPGIYPITRDHTKLSDIVRQAGGFTEFASLKSAELMRQSVGQGEILTERLLSLRGGVPVEDSTSYVLETELRLRKEIVNVDFGKLFLENDLTHDVILRNGDVVVIPSLKKTVYVFGQVVSPGHIPHVEGERVEYYLTKAGNFTDRARRDDTRIIKGKTKQWLKPDQTTIEEGDYVWVPKEPDRPFAYYMNIAGQAASTLSVVIGMAVLLVQIIP